MNDAPLRVPPHDLVAERGVLGSMLLSADAARIAVERLTDAAFYHLAHGDVFAAMAGLLDEHDALDLILVRDELARRERLDKVGGQGYLLELMESVPTSGNVEHYADIVRRCAVRRHVIDATAQAQRDAFDPAVDEDDLLDATEARMLAVRDVRSDAIRDAPTVLSAVFDRLAELQQNPGGMTGLATGFYDLDDLTGGLQPGDFVVLAARPSQGKTSLALNILHNVCAVQRRPAALFSLEMPAEQIVANFVCLHCRIDTHDFRRGTLTDRQWGALESAVDELADLPLYIDDSASMRILDLRARARRVVRRYSAEIIVVDYLQLLTARASHENRATEVAAISRGLKALARELRVPVLAVAQLNRRVEQEQRRPRMSDLRESGAIEQDADLILLLHRPHEDVAAEPDEAAGAEADLIVGKHRNGPTGCVRLVFQRRYLRFASRAAGG